MFILFITYYSSVFKYFCLLWSPKSFEIAKIGYYRKADTQHTEFNQPNCIHVWWCHFIAVRPFSETRLHCIKWPVLTSRIITSSASSIFKNTLETWGIQRTSGFPGIFTIRRFLSSFQNSRNHQMSQTFWIPNHSFILSVALIKFLVSCCGILGGFLTIFICSWGVKDFAPNKWYQSNNCYNNLCDRTDCVNGLHVL